MKKNLLTIAVQAAIITAVPALQVNAQDQTGVTTEESIEEFDEITATCFRLRRDSFNMVTPLVAIDADEIRGSAPCLRS